MVNENLLFQSAFQISPAALAITLAFSGRYVDVNESWLNLFEFSREEVIGRTSKELKIFRKNYAERDTAVDIITKQGIVRNLEINANTKTGKILHVLFSGQILQIDNEKYILSSVQDITERKKTQEALKQSEERFAKAFINNQAASAITRLEDGQYIDVNESFVRLSEFTKDELIGHTPKELKIYDPEERAIIMRKVRANGFVRDYELDARTKTGKSKTVLFSMQPVILNGQECAISTFIDITERKQTEEALKESERYQVTLLSQVHEAILGLDAKSRITYWNNNAELIFGWKAQEVIGKDSGPLMQNKIVGSTREAEVAKLIANGHWEGEANYKHKDGHYVACEVRAATIKNPDGKLTGIVTSIRDITERKKAEETLKESEERFRTVADSTPAMLFITDKKGHNLFVNKYYREFFNISGERAAGYSWQSFYHPDDRSDYLKKVSEAIKEQKPFNAQARVKRADGEWRWVETLAIPRFSYTKEYLGHVGLTIDVTERRNLETQLKEKDRLAAIGVTAGMVGHDIRNPLQAIIGDLYIAKEETKDMPQSAAKQAMQETMSSIEENVSYINKIVSDLQDYARPIKPEYSIINLTDILIRIFENVMIPDTIKLSIKITDLEKIRVDPMLVQRAISNLVTNAIQAMPKGGNLEIAGQQKARGIVITVKDTGEGIPDEIKPKLFTPMMTTKAKGQGFGLAVSKRIIEAMKGTISFESKKGEGTKFIIELPLT